MIVDLDEIVVAWQPVQRLGFSIVVMINSWSYTFFSQWLKLIAAWCILAWDIETNMRDGYTFSKRDRSLKCGIGISSIFDTVFRYLPIFLSVLDTPQCLPREVIKGGGHVCQAKKWKLLIKPICHFVKFRRICMGSSYQSKTGLVSSRQFATQSVLVFGK